MGLADGFGKVVSRNVVGISRCNLDWLAALVIHERT